MKPFQLIVAMHFALYIMMGSVLCEAAFGNNKGDHPFVIQIHDDLLTVKVKDAPLKKVLMEIAHQGNIKIVFFVSPEEHLVADFSRVTIEKGLKQLLYDYNHAFIYGSEKDKGKRSEVKKIIILSKKEELPNEKVEQIRDSSENLMMKSLSKSLKNNDPYVRREAVYSLGELEDVKSIKLLSAVLLNDKDEDVRAAATDILRDIGGEIVINSLTHALQDDDPDVRDRAVEALGAIGGGRAIQALDGTIAVEDGEVRDTAVVESEKLEANRTLNK